eukprot:502993-Amphidinium_carterae.2
MAGLKGIFSLVLECSIPPKYHGLQHHKTVGSKSEHITVSFATSLSNHKLPLRFCRHIGRAGYSRQPGWAKW